MWDAYVAGTIPVGAVVVDDAGEVVSRGRNRIFDDAHDTSLARSRLAHAELNALIPLGSERACTPPSSHATCVFLQPSRCESAAALRGARPVRRRGRETHPKQGSRRTPREDRGAVGRRSWTSARTPARGPLPMATARRSVARFYRTSKPDIVAAAERLPAPDAGATLVDAFAADS
jgi:hypothetical protein